jgi:hypothetical protein
MPSFLVLGICLLLLLFGDGEEVGCILFLYGNFDEDEGDNYGVINFLIMTIWRIKFSNGDIKADMMLPSWNNFLRSLLSFVVARFNHDEGLVRISLPLKPINGIEFRRFRSVFLILQWQKEEVRHKKKKKFMLNSAYRSAVRRSLDIYS